MNEATLEIKTGIQIRKPAAVVFEAIVDPAGMSQYFIATSTGRMETGKSLVWTFPEFGDLVPIRVGEVRPDQFISFYWEVDGAEHRTEISLRPAGPESTVVSVTEKGGKNDAAGIRWLQGNTEGWANFLACLKAWLEYGVHLREGAFDYRKPGA